jgi:hypothetical protein
MLDDVMMMQSSVRTCVNSCQTDQVQAHDCCSKHCQQQQEGVGLEPVPLL